MSDLIKREDALRALVDTDEIKGYAYVALEERLQEIPAVQPPVKVIGRIEVDMDEIFERVNDIVRCGECTYKGEINCPMYYRDRELKPIDFCSYGDRSEKPNNSTTEDCSD